MRLTTLLAYLGCSFAVGVFNAFNNFTLSLWLSGFTASYLLLGLLGNSRSFEGALVSPLAGAWSDRTWAGWLGRRRPFILVGGLTAAALLALTPRITTSGVLDGLPGIPVEAARLAPAILAIFLFTLAFNLMDDVHKALLPDISHGAWRNRLAAWAVVVDMGGQVAILALGAVLWQTAVPDEAFALAGGLVAVGVLWTVLGVREPAPRVWRSLPEPVAPGTPRGSVLRELRRYRALAIFCAVYFLYWSGVNAVLPLVSIYTRDVLGTSVGEAQLLPGLLLLSTTVLAIPMGILGTRFGKQRVLGLGFAILGVAALGGLVVTTREQGAVVFLLAGAGNAATMVLTIPRLAELVPAERVGMATGLLAASGSIAAPLSSVIAGVAADAFGIRAIFAIMALMTFAALLLLPFVRTTPATTEHLVTRSAA